MIIALLAIAVGTLRIWFLLRQRATAGASPAPPRWRWRWWLGWTVPVAAFAVAGAILFGDIAGRKLIGVLCMPAGLLWLALAAAGLACVWRRRWRAAALLAALWLGYGACGSPYLGNALLASLTARTAAVDPLRVEPFDAICVLGGGTELDDEGRPFLGNAGDRIALAAKLWHLEKTRVLVASGATIPGIDQSRDLAEEARVLWLGLAVQPDAIVSVHRAGEAKPVNTRQEIAAYQRLITERKWTRVGLLSSAWHLPRAMGYARRIGLAVVPIPADRRGRSEGFAWHWLVPQDIGFWRVGTACWEYLGMWTT